AESAQRLPAERLQRRGRWGEGFAAPVLRGARPHGGQHAAPARARGRHVRRAPHGFARPRALPRQHPRRHRLPPAALGLAARRDRRGAQAGRDHAADRHEVHVKPWPATAIVRATELAQAQCTAAEISGALAVEHERTMDEADAFIEEHAEELKAWRLRGRAQLRTKLQRIADGDPELGKKLTRTNIAAL